MNSNPTESEFNDSWTREYDFPFKDCEVNLDETSLLVSSPDVGEYNGGYGNTIQDPRLENISDLFYTGCGCTWNTDLDGNRYQLLDRLSLLPYDFESVKDRHVIKTYISNTDYRVRGEKIDKLLKKD